MLSPSDHILQLEGLVRLQMSEIDRLRALVAQRDGEIDGLIRWVEGGEDALSILQALYVDPRQHPSNRIRACQAAINFERAKPATTANVTFSLFRCLEDHRLKEIAAREAKAKTIEHSAPPLASDHGGDPLGPPDHPAA
jgi:hypothetical protein